MRKPSGLLTGAIFIFLLLIIFVGLFLLKVEPHMPLIAAIIFLACVGKFIGYKWEELEKGMIAGISAGIKPIIILSLVGMVIGAWMLSGTVPTLLYYGFMLLSPEWYFVSCLIVTIIVSTFTGSSFTTIGTIGVALMGIGVGMGINPALAAGAIISGACFGDKMSPLSDTTNFAPGIVSVDLFTHIRHLLWTTVPSLIITFILFLIIGFEDTKTYSTDNINSATEVLLSYFRVSMLTLISPLIVMYLAYRRYPTIPTLIVGIISAVITGIFTQKNTMPKDWLNVLQNGYVIESGNDIVDGILNRGGLQSMMWSVSLVLIALILGGIIQEMGLFKILIESVTNRIRRTGSLVLTTVASSIGINLLTGEQYLSILIPGQTFKDIYHEFSLHPKNLSRTLEDAGTLINPLIPWGVSGAFFANTLEVPVIEYLPFAFFLYLSPMFTILLAYLNIGITKLK